MRQKTWMKVGVVVLCLSSFVPVAFADDAPNEASIRKLMTLMEVQKNVDLLRGQLDAAMSQSMSRMMGDHPLTTAQQDIMKQYQTDLGNLIKEVTKWSDLEPKYIDIYKRSFTQKEVDAMLAFYGSPEGKAITAKIPQVMQESMQVSEAQLQQYHQKFIDLQKDYLGKLRDAK